MSEIENVMGMNAQQRQQYYAGIQERPQRVAASVAQQIEANKAPQTPAEKSLAHFVERRRQQNADPIRKLPCTAYNQKIEQLEVQIAREARQKEFSISIDCESTLRIFDANRLGIIERLSPEQKEALTVAREAYIQGAGDVSSESMFKTLGAMQGDIERIDRQRKLDLTQASLEKELESSQLAVEAAAIRVDVSEGGAE